MRLRSIVVGTTLLVVIAACGSSAPAGSVSPTPPPGATGTPAANTAPPGVSNPPTVTNPPATLPATTLGPQPTFVGDPDLAAKFPKTIDGQPVTGVTTARLIDFFRAFSTPEAQIEEFRQALAAIGIDFETVIFGNANATLNGSPFGFQAIKVPGKDANVVIQNYQGLSLTATNEGDTMKQETSGGKTVSVIRSAGGYASHWLYATGEIAWELATSDPEEAAALFTALP